MLDSDTRVEADFRARIEPVLSKHSVELARLSHDPRTDTFDVVLHLPMWADRHLRHEVLRGLANLEREDDFTFTTVPTFTWDDADDED